MTNTTAWQELASPSHMARVLDLIAKRQKMQLGNDHWVLTVSLFWASHLLLLTSDLPSQLQNTQVFPKLNLPQE